MYLFIENELRIMLQKDIIFSCDRIEILESERYKFDNLRDHDVFDSDLKEKLEFKLEIEFKDI